VSRFDAINAAFGRASGDAVLQAVAGRIERLADTDGRTRLAARMAGAEYAVLLDAPATLGDGQVLARELIEALSRPFSAGAHLITLACRAGLAISRPGDD